MYEGGVLLMLVIYISVISVVGFIWNCSKYKLLKSSLPHSCSKYSKSQSNWNMCSSWPDKSQRERIIFSLTITQQLPRTKHEPHHSLWPASDRLKTWTFHFRVTSKCLQSEFTCKLRAVVLPHLNCAGNCVSCVSWEKQALSLHVCITQEEAFPA